MGEKEREGPAAGLARRALTIFRPFNTFSSARANPNPTEIIEDEKKIIM